METGLKKTWFGGYDCEEVDRVLSEKDRRFSEECSALQEKLTKSEASCAQYAAECERLLEENRNLSSQNAWLSRQLKLVLHRLEREKQPFVCALVRSIQSKWRKDGTLFRG